MALNQKSTTTVSATGVGRKDYSQNVEFSVEKEIRSLQERFFYSYQFTGLTTLAFPDVYESLLQFLVDGALQNEAPSQKPWLFYLIEATGHVNSLAVITLNRYLSYADYLAGTIHEQLGTSFGFLSTHDAKIELTKGIATVAGSVYSVQYGVFSGADFDMELVVHGLIGGQEDL